MPYLVAVVIVVILAYLEVVVHYRLAQKLLRARLVAAVGDVLVELALHPQQRSPQHLGLARVVLDTL